MAFLIPKDWGNFQHYKDRAPAWIKLHGGLLDDYEFHCLPLASRALAPMLWLLASKYDDGKIPLDHAKIAFRLRMSVDELADSLKPLIDGGFFRLEQDASKPLAECLPREREEREEEKEKPLAADASSPAAPPVPHRAIIDLYNEVLGSQGLTLVKPALWKGSRETNLRARWREAENRQSLDWWRGWFEYIAESDFLMGKASNQRPFRADLEWLVTFKNFAKVCEGKYHG